MMFWMGIYPQTFLRKIDSSVAFLVNRIHNRERVFVMKDRPAFILKDAALEDRSLDKAKPAPQELEEDEPDE
jgi:hypothetical protein